MVNYVYGDVLASPDLVIAHGCNATGVMGSGVAKQVKEKYPNAFADYNAYCKHNPVSITLGTNVYSTQPDGKTIVNCITQEFYGRAMGIKFVSYDAVDKCFADLAEYCDTYKIENISMPKIGAGLGGGNWSVIEAIINAHFKFHETLVNVYYVD